MISSPRSVVVKLNVAVPPSPIEGSDVIVSAVPSRAFDKVVANLSWLLARPLASVGAIA